MTWLRGILWAGLAAAGAISFGTIAFVRHEPVSAGHLLLAAVASLLIGYRFYSKFLAARVLALDDRRATPAVRLADGRDFVPTNRWVAFGHHFAAIAGPGPLLGPTLAAQFGYLPGTIWILGGVLLGGAVQDFVILAFSLRRDGRSLARMVRDSLGPLGAVAGTVGILFIMVILIAVLALVVVNLLAESPWGLFTCLATIPIAVLMGAIMKGRGGRSVAIATIVGIGLLVLAAAYGRLAAAHPALGGALTLGRLPLAWGLIAYGLTASILPMWLLLAPRDYLSTFVKLGTIFLLAAGIALVRPELKLPAVTPFASGNGPLFGGGLFPFCFITIACGAISGFHALVASGTTPRLLTRETDARMVGYGSMLLEAFVAIMAMIAAASLPPGQFFAINSKMTPAWITERGFPVTQAQMDTLAARVGEKTLMGRAGGSSSLAVGMASIFRDVAGGDRAVAVWYHFAVMFEVLFILTTLDAGTRVGRYLLQDALARASPRLAGGSWAANVSTSVAFVAVWGYFLVAAVLDPQGGIRALWPLFGLSNQLLAGTALAIATTILVRTGRARFALVTGAPLAFLLTVTMTAGIQLIGSADPSLGFLAKAAASTDRVEAWNARLDAAVAAVLLVLVATVVASAARQIAGVLAGRIPVSPELPPEGGGGPVFGEVRPVGGRTRCC
ncbi:MAG TPA: carbon starvation CstA family protein [Candidatus Sulfotelmatobacter sp.]|jgi:carbon starvation protein|nr:carbon starvation CstA family protein [Candidatus Sulfotelmatobacter sp.]